MGERQQIDGITIKSKRTLKKSHVEVIEVYYNDTFLNFVWHPQKWKGPNGERYTLPESFNADDLFGDWLWFYTIDDAAKHLLQIAFVKNL